MTTWELFQNFGLPLGMLIVALATGARGDWIFGREAKEKDKRIARLEEQLDHAQKLADRGTHLGERGADLVEKEVRALRDERP